MSTRKTTLFYAVLIALASVAVGMVIASRLDLSPHSMAQVVNVPTSNSAPPSDTSRMMQGTEGRPRAWMRACT